MGRHPSHLGSADRSGGRNGPNHIPAAPPIEKGAKAGTFEKSDRSIVQDAAYRPNEPCPRHLRDLKGSAMTDRCYTIADATTIERILSELARWFDGVREMTGTETLEVLDSFDWRLFNNGWLLFNTQEGYSIVDIHSWQEVSKVAVNKKRQPQFHWEFPESHLAECLGDILEMRALLPLGVIKRQWVHYDLLNNDQKIVARLVFETYAAEGGLEPVRQCRLMPLRGYTKAAKQLGANLENLGLQPVNQSAVLILMERQGLAPGAYSSKINIALKPETPAAEAVRCIMERLIAVMQANQPGVLRDIDTEFLHDFRVSVRRARSLLSQMKGILDADTTANLQRQLKAMGAVTGHVRDLDVYLLNKTEYMGKVPDVLTPGINHLFRMLQRKRGHAKDRMLKAMAGTDFNAALSDLETFVRSDPLADSDAQGGSRPIGDVAKAVIYKRFRRIIKKGGQISAATPDKRLHDLRIDCKKLRYLLEFFTSLFPQDQMKMLVKQLKQLQENLGEFNDLSVQQAFLIDHLKTIKPQTAQASMLAAATGGLITRLHMAHGHVREQFFGVFSEFNTSANREQFKALFT
jgi:CHAD domain-containing protein